MQPCVNCSQPEHLRQGCRSIVQGKKDTLQCKVCAVFIKPYLNSIQSQPLPVLRAHRLYSTTLRVVLSPVPVIQRSCPEAWSFPTLTNWQIHSGIPEAPKISMN